MQISTPKQGRRVRGMSQEEKDSYTPMSPDMSPPDLDTGMVRFLAARSGPVVDPYAERKMALKEKQVNDDHEFRKNKQATTMSFECVNLRAKKNFLKLWEECLKTK